MGPQLLVRNVNAMIVLSFHDIWPPQHNWETHVSRYIWPTNWISVPYRPRPPQCQVLHHLTCATDLRLAKNDEGGGSLVVSGQMDHHAAVIVGLSGLWLPFPPPDWLAEVGGESWVGWFSSWDKSGRGGGHCATCWTGLDACIQKEKPRLISRPLGIKRKTHWRRTHLVLRRSCELLGKWLQEAEKVIRKKEEEKQGRHFQETSQGSC